MQPKVELAQIRTLSEITDDSILFFKQNWKALFKSYFIICGFFWVAGLIIAVVDKTQSFQLKEFGESFYSPTFFMSIFFSFLNYILILLTVFAFTALYHEKGNVAPAVEEVWAYVKYYFLRVLGTAILLTILWAAGIVLCIFPGIYLSLVFLLILAVMVHENGDFNYSFKRGFRLIKDKWWQMMGVLIVMSILVCAALLLFTLPIIIIVAILLTLTRLDHDHTIGVTFTLAIHALQFLSLLPAIAIVLIYFNFNERADDSNLLQRIAMLGKQNKTIDELPSEEY